MRTRIELGTDIAMIGLWDPTRERHDLKHARYADFESSLMSEAEAGRLFFIYTGADGGYLTDIYVDETPDPNHLTAYSAAEREFLIVSESGRLIAGGIEDFVSQTKQITSEQDELTVAPGQYALRVHQLVESKMAERLRGHIGEEDYTYFGKQSGGIPWAYLLFVMGTIALFARLWTVAIGLLGVWAGYVILRSRRRLRDVRFREISARIAAFDEQFPPFLFVLRRLADTTEIKGGWYQLD